MKVFNVKTKHMETFDPTRHAGMFICLYSHGQVLSVGKCLGWSKGGENVTFLFVEANEIQSCIWDDTCCPKIFESEEECNELRVSINLEHTEWQDSLKH